MRSDGLSIREIAKSLKISRSTASLWCRKVTLTNDQQSVLLSKSPNLDKLREYANKRHLEKVKTQRQIFDNAISQIDTLTEKETFLVGIALYWAEGFKNVNEGRIGFCNSDPRMIRFMIHWFKQVFKVTTSDFIIRAEFNITHMNRKEDIEKFWSSITDVQLSQFNQPYIQKSVWKRDYSLKKEYYGVCRIRLRKSSRFLPAIRGWIQGVHQTY